MGMNPDDVVRLISSARRLVGLKELLKVGEYSAGAQTELKRVLRELVRKGVLVREGKRFGAKGQKPIAKSGPAWQSPPAVLKKTPNRLSHNKSERSGSRNAERRVGSESSIRTPKPTQTRRKLVEGTIHHHRDGFAFVKALVGQDFEDVFVPPDEAARALDHDQVVIEIVPGRSNKTMGRLVEIKSRTRQLVVGIYHEAGKRAWVTPREKEVGAIRVPFTQLARPGDAVKVRLGVGEALFEAHDTLTGEVAGSLGSPDDHSVEVLSVAYAKGFHDEFPSEVMDESDDVPIVVSDDEARGEKRRDLRSMPLVTIDGDDARDFDDAIYVEPKNDGWRLVVAIADVAHYVREDTALNTEALRRATSVYLPRRVLPMLPERLSNGICSLKPNEDRLCMVADMAIDRQGRTTKTELYPAVMRSHARCTYGEVHRVLTGEEVAGRTQFRRLFENAQALAVTLRKMRFDRGAIDFEIAETKVVLNGEGLPVGMERRERWESHRLVEECMLAANEAVARFFRERELPTVNRFHGDPDEDRLHTFIRLLNVYGIAVPTGEMTSKMLNQVLAQLQGHPEQRALNQLALRSMMQAVYSVEQSGHYGLGAQDYLHFTSPIRRYPDLLVHRLLKACWAVARRSGRREVEIDKLEALAVQCSERERAAMQVEREVNALYACLLIKDRLGEEFQGTVCGLSENGFFVELDEVLVEGFVPGESVASRFEFDALNHCMRFGSGRVVKIGNKLSVVVTNVNLSKKQIEFQASAFPADAAVEKKRIRADVRSKDRGATAPPSSGFDARAVLDRLWRERGGKKEKSEAGGRPSKPGNKPGTKRRH